VNGLQLRPCPAHARAERLQHPPFGQRHLDGIAGEVEPERKGSRGAGEHDRGRRRVILEAPRCSGQVGYHLARHQVALVVGVDPYHRYPPVALHAHR
jgi:hypothetical protein